MKKIISLSFAVLALMIAMATVSFAQQSGKCGDNLTWELNDGVLTISGTGEMYDYETADKTPWYLQKDEIISVSVNGAENIGAYSFFGFTNLNTVKLSETIKTIGSNAFIRCESLTEITIPNSVNKIEDKAFSYCISLEDITLSSNLADIGNDAFMGCTSLKTVALPDSVENIGTGAFMDCAGLAEVKFPEEIKNMGSCAFANCISLKSIKLPYVTDNYSGAVFGNCASLETVEMSNKIKIIGNGMFTSCKNLKNVTFSSELEEIENGAFIWCTSLETLNFNDTLAIIHEEAFAGCTSIKKVKFPESIQEIKGSSFKDCTSLTTVTIPNDVDTDPYAFRGCENLKEINSDTFKRNDDGIIYTTDEICLVHCPNDFEGVCIIPSTVNSMSTDTFSGCSEITAVNIPLVYPGTIGYPMFKDCTKLKTIALPNGLNFIYADSFKDCESLDCVYFSGSEQDWDKIKIFENNEHLINAPRYYNSTAITLVINDQVAKCVRMPFVTEGVTMVPVRDVMEMLGAEVTYIPQNHTVSVTVNGNTVTASVGSNLMQYNGSEFYCETAPRFVGGNIFVPLKAVADKFGADVEWDGEKQRVSVMY